MRELTFLDPAMLALAAVLPLALFLGRRLTAPSLGFAASPLLAGGLPRSWRMWLLPLPLVLDIVGLLLVVVALARPADRVQLPLEREGIDIVLCIDTSSSMSAKDMDPERTRLTVAKDAAKAFVDGREYDRIGLVRFARYSDVVCPRTLDHGALGEFLATLAQVEPDGPEDMTGIGNAIARTAQILRKGASKSKVVILLTDGEENVATAETPDEIGPARAALLCRRLGVRVYTIAAGIGKQDRKGNWVPLDTTQVRELADLTGGAFFEARDADAIAKVYATIDELETSEFDEPRYELEDAFLPFLIAAIGVVLLARLLRSTVFEVLP